jgi:hypothetical protein
VLAAHFAKLITMCPSHALMVKPLMLIALDDEEMLG